MTTKKNAPKIIRRKISDYTPDLNNANKGNERGLQMVEKALNEVGAGRSIVVDGEGNIVAGNKTMEAAQLAGIEEMIEITTTGDAIIVHRREDWNLNDPTGPARQYAYLDNRANEVGLTWDANKIAADVANGVPMGNFFQPWELAPLLGTNQEPIDRVGMWNGMPGYEQNDLECFQTIKVHFNSKEDAEAFSKLVGQPINEQTKFIYYPRLEHANRKAHQVIDEGDSSEP